MKKFGILALILIVAAAACSTKKVEGTKLPQDTPAYKLGKDLTAILPLLDPDKNAVLFTAKNFTVTVGDVLEVIKGTAGSQADQLKQFDAARLKTIVHMLIRAFLTKTVFGTIKIEPAEIDKAYAGDKTATVRHILLLTQGKPDAEKPQIRKKMEGILERARKGEDFAALAKEFTEDPGSKETGGLYEDFERGKMVKPFEDAAFSIPVGQISDIVETAYGYHILKVENRKKETEPLDKVKAQIEETLKKQKQGAAYEAYMTELKAKGKLVEVK